MNNIRRLWQSRVLRLTAALVAVLLVVVGWINMHFTVRLRDDEAIKTASSSVVAVLDVLEVAYAQGGIEAVQRLLEGRFAERPGVFVYMLRDSAGAVIGTNIGALDPKDADMIVEEARQMLPPVGGPPAEGFAHESRELFEDSMSVVFRTLPLPDGHQVAVGLNTAHLRASLDLLDDARRLISYAVWAVGLSMVLVVAYLIARVNQISDTTREIIETGDLSRRVPLRMRFEDFGQLAQLLNTMLDRIEGQMDSVRHVADNIAHDLRTPLSRLRNRLEILRARPDAATADELVAEADNILGIFNSLLHIANVEQERRTLAFAPVDLAVLIGDVVEVYEPLAGDRGVLLEARVETAVLPGNKHLLFQAIANLVDNAIKFTPSAGRIDVTIERSSRWFRLVVADSGPGVPPEMRDKVFERFRRLDSSRNLPGNGLGLSLVRAVVQLHRGCIRLADNSPGLRIEIDLPAVSDR